jgi:hypothetical protein
MTLFDRAESEILKKIGMEQASSYPFDEPIGRARNIAIMLAIRNGTVCADDVYQYLLDRLPDVLKEIPANGWGSVLKSPKLKFTGRIVESNKVSRHRGMQRVWEYNG